MLYRYRQLIVSIKSDDIYKDIAEDVQTRFDNLNQELDGPLLKEKNKKVINERCIRQKNHERICCIKSKKQQAQKHMS